jgi:hypothetical protein
MAGMSSSAKKSRGCLPVSSGLKDRGSAHAKLAEAIKKETKIRIHILFTFALSNAKGKDGIKAYYH